MSRQRELGGIDPDRALTQIKAFKLLNCEGRTTMHYIFTIACNKSNTQNLQDYLIDERKMKKEDYEKWFSIKQREKILRDPSGSDFDITLLHRCLGLPLPGLAKLGTAVWTQCDENKLEYLITQIKDLRNDVVHDKEIRSKGELITFADDVKKLLGKTYNLAASRYSRDDAEADNYISVMKSEIDSIVLVPHMRDFQEWKKMMEDLQSQQICHVKEVISNLKEKYLTTSKIHPASFLSHVESLQIETVYCKEGIVNEIYNDKSKRIIDHDLLLKLQTKDGKEPSVVVVEGEAGMGKTSLVKFILAEWARLPNQSNTILGLNDYELILHFEFRTQFISTFLDLLLFLFDSSSLRLTHNQLITSVLSLRTLVLLDGADEWNKNSKCLLQELLRESIPKSNGKLRVLCTTRPERLDKLLDYVESQSWVHIKITGIPPDKQFVFTKKSMEGMFEMKVNESIPENPSDITNIDTQIQKLETFMESSQSKMGEQFKLPLNLALLAYLWIHHSDQICLATSTTELYTAFHNLALMRLLRRLVHQTGKDKKELERLCKDFLLVLYKECLTALSQDAMQMPQECISRLEKFCTDNLLPSSDMLENYMEVYNEWSSDGYLTVIVPPHKSKLEFFSAHAIINDVCGTHDIENILISMQELLDLHKCPQEIGQAILNFAKGQLQVLNQITISTLLKSFHTSTKNLDLSRYQNMLLLMAGIMFHSHKDHIPLHGPELLDLLQESGLQPHQFLTIVAETKNCDEMAKLVAKKLSKKPLNVSDGHVGAARAVLPHLAADTEVKITLKGDLRHLSDLDDLIKVVAPRPCRVLLVLKRLLRTTDTSADHLLELLQDGRCSLIHLEGHFTSRVTLPNSLIRLDLSAAPDSDPALPRLQHLTRLCHLDVHVSRAVNPEHLRQLPSVGRSGIRLHLYHVDDSGVEWSSRVVRVLKPTTEFLNSLCFPSSELSPEGCKDLVETLADSTVKGGKVKVEQIEVSSRSITDGDLPSLAQHTKKKLECKFSRI